MSLLFCSFFMLVCLGEKMSARMTTLASSPFELWIVITLTAFVGGTVDASMAKIGACEAALSAGRASLQVHGAIGYTYEQDVHLWMKRAWSLDLAFGDSVFHRNRLCAGVIDASIPARSFGYSPPGT